MQPSVYRGNNLNEKDVSSPLGEPMLAKVLKVSKTSKLETMRPSLASLIESFIALSAANKEL